MRDYTQFTQEERYQIGERCPNQNFGKKFDYRNQNFYKTRLPQPSVLGLDFVNPSQGEMI
jgi:hypothetical protein